MTEPASAKWGRGLRWPNLSDIGKCPFEYNDTVSEMLIKSNYFCDLFVSQYVTKK